jgi:ABC-2 type transport system ATP-binding protein
MDQPAVIARGLHKTMGRVHALAGVDLTVPAGTTLGLLGPNGAGKTTTVRILTTLLRADAGQAQVAGHDVARAPAQVRRVIGVSGQYAAIDAYLTGRENLVMVGRLSGLGSRSARRRADDLMEQLGLVEAGDRLAGSYSGGMRRRLDVAASLVARPAVLFLDEPTTGLDIRARMAFWTIIAELTTDGSSVLLTTQYLEEADLLAGTIAIMDAGRVIATGTPEQLKAQVGGERLELRVPSPGDPSLVAAVVADLGLAAPVVQTQTRTVTLPVSESRVLIEAVARLAAQGIQLTDAAIRRPSLDEVFLALTGRPALQDAPQTRPSQDTP